MAVAFRVCSYNVLAPAYATRRLYPDVDPAVLDWSRRGPAVVERVVGLAPDVACLQEVEATAWPALAASFARAGWQGAFAAKGRGRPDGCAVLHRPGALRFVDASPLHFDDGIDGGPGSGHLALVATFASDAGLVRIAGTHLRWQAATVEDAAHIGFRQAAELLAHVAALRPAPVATIVCGDLNAPPGSAIGRLFQANGLADAYAGAAQPTCAPNRRPARIDAIHASAGLAMAPLPLAPIDAGTVLPSATEPSDHLPIAADCVVIASA